MYPRHRRHHLRLSHLTVHGGGLRGCVEERLRGLTRPPREELRRLRLQQQLIPIRSGAAKTPSGTAEFLTAAFSRRALSN